MLSPFINKLKFDRLNSKGELSAISLYDLEIADH